MPSFKPSFIGEDNEMCFICERCQVNQQEAISYDTYNRPLVTILRQPGQCVSCDGTGFLRGSHGQLCPECGGTGVCSECDGRYARDWSDLSDETRALWTRWWDEHADEFESYGTAASFYRKW